MEKTQIKKYFVSEQVDDEWIWRIKNLVGPWVAQKGNSGWWDHVNIYSQYLGILKKGLIRRDFAELIVTLHPNGLNEKKTYQQLKGSMDQLRLSIKLNEIETYPPKSERGIIVSELRELFATPVSANKQVVTTYTVESRMKEYLDKRIATDLYASILSGETYCGYTTTLSIERYASEEFKAQKKPSSILVVECYDTKVSDDTISLSVGRFGGNSKIKLVIAASSGFNEHVKKVAIDRNVCLIRVNPQYEITDRNILTPRLASSVSVHKYEQGMLSNKYPMTVPLVIQDGCYYTTTSLSGFLKRYDIPINDPGVVRAPYLSHDFIEEVVSELIADDVQQYAVSLEQCSLTDRVPYCLINPYKYAEQDHLKIIRTDLSKQIHLGNIDMKNKVVRLTDSLKEDDPRDRFSMAHEFGHNVLHSHPMFRDFLKRDAELEGQAESDILRKKYLEMQANYFASCMLMPRRLVVLLYNLYYRKWFKRDVVTPLYIKEPMYWDKDFQNVVNPVARHLGVSSNAIKNRLMELRLLVDANKIGNKIII